MLWIGNECAHWANRVISEHRNTRLVLYSFIIDRIRLTISVWSDLSLRSVCSKRSNEVDFLRSFNRFWMIFRLRNVLNYHLQRFSNLRLGHISCNGLWSSRLSLNSFFQQGFSRRFRRGKVNYVVVFRLLKPLVNRSTDLRFHNYFFRNSNVFIFLF